MSVNEHLSKINDLSKRIEATKQQSADLLRRYNEADKKVFRSRVWGSVMKANPFLPTKTTAIITDEKERADLLYEKAEIASGLEDLHELLMVLQGRMEELLVTLPGFG